MRENDIANAWRREVARLDNGQRSRCNVSFADDERVTGRMSGAEEREARSVALEKAYVHEVYEQISGTQFPVGASADSQRGRAWPKVKQFLSELEPGSLVCDVGCGNGKYLSVNPSVFKIGADRCSSLTEIAREKEHEVLVCDNLSLPFRDESFDAVLSVAVVHHFATTERRVGALRELARVLRIGGRLIISVWAMEQRHRKFESQDVLVPWHRPQHLSTPSLELTSTTTTTSEEDGPPPYHAYTQTSDSDSCRSARKLICHFHIAVDKSEDIGHKLAGGKRGGSGHRPWFLDSWSSCTKEPPPPHRYDPEGCEDGEGDGEDIQDLPIELRRLEEDQHEAPQRRQTFACARRATPHEVILNHKSKSLSDILTVGQRAMVRSRSSVPSLGVNTDHSASTVPATKTTTTSSKPKLVKQKKSLCEEEMDEEGEEPSDMRDLVKALPEFKVSGHGGTRRYGNVFKQSSMNEELMSTERLREKERVRQNIQKQASLNEELIYRRHRTLDSLRDTFFSTSTAKRFQLLKNGLTSKLKSSTTGIEKVAGTSFKNGFVRILQGWKGEVSPSARPSPMPTPSEAAPPCTPPPDSKKLSNNFSGIGDDNNKKELTRSGSERRHSREDGSDSSKDSSLQSDTSVDSEDSFASVIFVPKPDLQQPDASTPAGISTGLPTSPATTQMSPPKSPQPTSPKVKQTPTSPKVKQPTSPQVKLSPPALTPVPAPKTPPIEETPLEGVAEGDGEDHDLLSDDVEPPAAESKHSERGATRNAFPLVRRSSAMVLGRPEPLARPLPRLLSLELFNPETDDMDSDSSGVSSPDSVSSVISVLTEEPVQVNSTTQQGTQELPAVEEPTQSQPVQPLCSPTSLPPPPPPPVSTSTTTSPKAPEIVTERLLLEVQEAVEEETGSSESLTTEPPPRVSPSSLSLLEAAADVASSLEDAVDAVIQSSPRARRRKLQLLENNDPMAVLQGGCFSGSSSSSSTWSLHKSDYSPAADGKLYSDWGLHKPATASTSPVIDPRNNNYPWSVGHSPGESRKLSPRLERRYDDCMPEESEEAYPQQEETWDENCRQHLADFAEKLSEKLLEEIDQYRMQTSQQPTRPRPVHNKILAGLEHLDDPYLSRLSEELQDLTKLSEELQERNSYIASLNNNTSDLTSIPPPPPLLIQDTLYADPFISPNTYTEELNSNTVVIDVSEQVKEELTPEPEPKPEPETEANLAISSESIDDLSCASDVMLVCSRQTSEDITEDLETCVEVLGNKTIHQGGEEVILETNEESVQNQDSAVDESISVPVPSVQDTSAGPSDSEQGPLLRSIAGSAVSLRPGYSMESSDAGDVSEQTGTSGSDCSRRDTNSAGKTASTASLGPNSMESSDAGSERTGSGSDCSRDLRYADRRAVRCDGRSSSEEAPPRGVPLVRQKAATQEPPEALTKTESCASSLSGSTSQESLPSDNGGGAITFHRYYHVFREGELDQLIERYVENLHIISSYYDHANWCVVAEKVHVWTI
ncbi:hypothetical protein C0J52_01590 [Blattella germanica]|nr:hypothetical protein C0J52_01590 [Blattella germanica]